MIDQQFISKLVVKNEAKIVFLVIDGLGGLPDPKTRRSELETAYHPNFDILTSRSLCGFSDPVGTGITPGSGPGHLAIFGYDPTVNFIGRGLLDTLGIGLELQPQDLAARGNFATIDNEGIVKDRRAGRIPTDQSRQLCEKLAGIKIEDVEVIVNPVKEHRISVLFRGEGLSDKLSDADPQKENLPIPDVKGADNHGATEKAVRIVNAYLREAKSRLTGCEPGNAVLLRGFAKMLDILHFNDIYQLRAAAVAVYPMYKGLARLVGMEIINFEGETPVDEFNAVKNNWDNFDYFFVHIKAADSAGEDGNFEKKVKVIEEIDKALPSLLNLKPDVSVITGDHSTPSVLKGHSWHPVPVIINSGRCPYRGPYRFTEMDFVEKGLLGRVRGQDIMTLAMANAGKLAKYGA